MFKYSLLAAFIAYILTTIAVSYTNDLGAAESMFGAGFTAALMIEVWGRRKKRIPTP